jgi:hypothetical protein
MNTRRVRVILRGKFHLQYSTFWRWWRVSFSPIWRYPSSLTRCFQSPWAGEEIWPEPLCISSSPSSLILAIKLHKLGDDGDASPFCFSYSWLPPISRLKLPFVRNSLDSLQHSSNIKRSNSNSSFILKNNLVIVCKRFFSLSDWAIKRWVSTDRHLFPLRDLS